MDQHGWYLGRGGKQLGPYKWAAILQLAAAKKLRAGDLLWSEGMNDWTRADTFSALNLGIGEIEQGIASQGDDVPRGNEAAFCEPEDARANKVAVVQASTSIRGNYFARHWRGDLSLPVSYWINGSLGTVVVVALMKAASSTDFLGSLGAFGSGASILGFLGFAYTATIWQSVGIWRSAEAHKSRGGSTGWASVARVMVAVGLLGTVGTVTQQFPLWKQGFELVAGVERTPKSEFRVLNRATELELSGGMSFGTADKLETILKATPTIRVIHLNNDGGWISEGLRVGKLVESSGLTTFTGRECVSACLLAFFGGKERLLGVGARLGFHQASVGGVGGSVAEAGDDEFRALFVRKGIPAAFIDKALSTPPTDMWYPSVEELISANVVTEVVDPRKYATSGLSSWKSRESIASELAAIPVMAAFKSVEPESYASYESMFVDGYRDGISQAELVSKGQEMLRDKIVPKYLKVGPNKEIVRYLGAELSALKELREIDPDLCLEFLGLGEKRGRLDIQRQVTKATTEEDLASLIQLLRVASARPSVAPSAKDVAGPLGVALKRAEIRVPGVLTVLAKPSESRDTRRVCDAFIALYQSVLELPESESGPVLRYLMSE